MRLGLAAGRLVAPAAFVRALGADAGTARRVTWLTRMLGVRDLALAVGVTGTVRRGGDARGWLLAAGAADAVDAVVIARAASVGRLGGSVPGLVAVAGAGSAVAHVVAALAQGSSRAS
ncbi:hypothetical protein [Jatrophihabitans endophyticus]|uniref:hypothetical protein n=1 Tax=Jatrophihabitans endophyticus TaxID=1206085 RepID=UPI0009353C1F|nr:hypothetical protein [Jatrophihabitans endophyticus]